MIRDLPVGRCWIVVFDELGGRLCIVILGLLMRQRSIVDGDFLFERRSFVVHD